MTSPIFARPAPPSRPAPRRPLRALAVAAGLAAAFTLTACGGGGDDDAEDKPSAISSASASAGGRGASASAAPGELEGSWLATTDGKAVALVITGSRAGLFATGGTVCSGTAAEQSIRLRCTDGSTDRANGAIGTVNGTALTVAWEGGLGEETYTKSEGGRMPTGLPKARSGS